MIAVQKTVSGNIHNIKDIAEYRNLCIDQKVHDACQMITALKKDATRLDEADPERERIMEEVKRLKKSLSLVTFMATFKGSKRVKADMVLNGLYLADYDGVDADEIVSQIKAKFGSVEEFAKQQRILVVKKSCGGGLHIVGIANETVGNIAANLIKLDEVIGLKHDPATETPNQGCFVSSDDYHYYYSEDVVTYDNPHFEELFGDEYRTGKVTRSTTGAKKTTASTEGEKPSASIEKSDEFTPDSLFYGHTYREIQEALWAKLGGVPQVGERSQKMMKFLARYRFICDNNPEMVKATFVPLPQPQTDSELDSQIQNACKLKVYLSMPRELQEVLMELGIETSSVQSQDQLDAAQAHLQLHNMFYSDFKRLRLNPFFKAVTSGVPENMRIGMALGVLPMLYTLGTTIQFTHFDGKKSRLSGMFFGIGKAASGKGHFETLDEIIMKVIRDQDKAGWTLEHEYKINKELNKNKEHQEARPNVPVIFVPLQVSNTKLAERLRNAVLDQDDADDPFYCHLYTFDTELATFNRVKKSGSWAEKDDIYCKAFHNEMWGQDYATDNSVSGLVQVNLNLVVTGTEDAMDTFIHNGNILGGLPTRLMYFPMPYEAFKILQKNNSRTAEQMECMREVAMKLNTLREPIIVDAKPITDDMYRWCAEMAKVAEDNNDYELDDLRKRTALIGERAAVIYAIVDDIDNFIATHKLVVTPMAKRFGRFVASYCLQSQYIKFASRMREVALRNQEKQGVQKMFINWRPIFAALPMEFTTEDIRNLNASLSGDTVRQKCKRWVKKGFLKRIENGVYQKLKKTL